MRLAICAAFPHELKYILKNLKDKRVLQRHPLLIFLAHSHSDEIAVMQTGMGSRNAGAAFRELYDEYKPDFLLSVGFGGALYSNASAGDIIWASRSILIPGHSSKGPIALSPVDLPGAREIAGRLSGQINIREGCIVTLEQQMAKHRLKRMLPQGLNSPVCDMETYHLARLALQRGLPFFAIRAITDPAQEDIPAELFSVVDSSGTYSLYRALTLLISRPQLIPGSIRLGIHSERAAKRLWHAVSALLNVLTK